MEASCYNDDDFNVFTRANSLFNYELLRYVSGNFILFILLSFHNTVQVEIHVLAVGHLHNREVLNE